jgi:phosphonate transport system substrate-binding protein
MSETLIPGASRAMRALGTTLLALALGAGWLTGAEAQDWRSKYPTIVYAQGTNENAATKTELLTPFVEYVSKKLRVKVQLRVVNDYAAVIEGQRSGNIHVALHGGSSYARAIMTGVKIEPFVIDVYKDGTKGYYSVFYVKADSPYRSIEDLKGKNLGLVDPNSASGNTVPRYAMHQMKIDPDKYFSKVVYTGSHENAVLALLQGTVDVAANWWNNETESNLARMERAKMAKVADLRIIFKSELMAASPHTYLSDLPAQMKADIAQAFLDAPREAPEAFAKAANGGRPYERVTHETYVPFIELNRFVDNLRRQRN